LVLKIFNYDSKSKTDKKCIQNRIIYFQTKGLTQQLKEHGL